MSGLLLRLVSGLASPLIFVPSLAVGWFARRWWQVVIGAVVVGALSDAEVMLIELPGATPDWTDTPFVVIAPFVWCTIGFVMRAWHWRASLLRGGPIGALPVVAGMTLGAVAVAASALGVGLFYQRMGELDYHTMEFGRAPGADYETIFFQYLFPGLLLGQVAGGLVGRVLGRRVARPPA